VKRITFLAFVVLAVSCEDSHEKVSHSNGICTVHNQKLIVMSGFIAKGTSASVTPSKDYLQFYEESLFPNVLPLGFVEVDNGVQGLELSKVKVHFCPVCENTFQAGFAKFKALRQEEKNAYEENLLRRELRRYRESN
jgi:hypothetical protein